MSSAWTRPGRWLPLLSGGLLALAAAQLIAIKAGWLPAPPSLVAATVAASAAALLTECAYLGAGLLRKELRPLRGVAGLLVCSGLLSACAGGMANWLFSLQGAIILTEGEVAPLDPENALQVFEAGWLSDLGEMRLEVALREMELRAEGGGYYPESKMGLRRGGGEWETLTVSSRASVQSGTLRFHQGAFGFSPRIVLLREGESLFDRYVPFLSRREEGAAVAFKGDFSLMKEGLKVEGEIRLDSLDDAMRGHPTLSLAVMKGDRLLGTGDLLPGHFADLEDGYRIGFAGLKKWSEIDISRKNYPVPILAGLGLMLLGAVLWPVAVWRKW